MTLSMTARAPISPNMLSIDVDASSKPGAALKAGTRVARPARDDEDDERDAFEEAPWHLLPYVYMSFVILIVLGRAREWAAYVGRVLRLVPRDTTYTSHKGKAALLSDFESFYTRRMYQRIRDCWNRPTTGVPNSQVTLLTRASDDYNKTFRYVRARTRTHARGRARTT